MDSRQVADVAVWTRGYCIPRRTRTRRERCHDFRFDVRRREHSEHGELRTQLERELRLRPRDSPRQVPDLEEPPHVDRAAIENVIPIDVCETDRRQIHSATRDYAAFDADIGEVLFLDVSADLTSTRRHRLSLQR